MPSDWPDDQTAARRLLERCIEEGLREVLDSGAEIILRSNPVEQLAEDPRRLHEVLVPIFAEQGAVVIERRIGKRLLDRLGSGQEDRPIRRFAELIQSEKKGSSFREQLGSTAASFAEAFVK